ncbi:MAG: DnaJ domain-containing protein, partial [Piptocephalis tieghemiana]
LPLFLALLTLLLLSPPTAAWEQIDMDIFDLVEQVNRFHGGKKTSFYSILHVEQDATVPEITRAHRKLSLSMHPDKNPSPEAKDRFNMLGAVTRTLKNPETRARYDFYLKNGVPVRHGATYLYSRYRPPLSHVLLFLGFFISAVQYLLAHV